MEQKNILMRVEDKIATVTINQPEILNALSAETVTELYQVFKKLKGDEQVRVVILTGSGEKAFVAGADIKEINRHDDISGRIFALRGQKVFRFIENMEKPVIAAVNGFALGGGCELAMACHLRIASSNARFGQPEINLGLIPGYGGTQRLPRLIGRGRSLQMLLTGELIDAETALSYGLVNEVTTAENLMDRAILLAKQLAEKPAVALGFILQAVNEGLDMNFDAAMNLESELFGNICNTDDMKEGTAAFIEKRKPQFTGK